MRSAGRAMVAGLLQQCELSFRSCQLFTVGLVGSGLFAMTLTGWSSWRHLCDNRRNWQSCVNAMEQLAGEARATDVFRKEMVPVLAQNSVRIRWPSNSRSTGCGSDATASPAYDTSSPSSRCSARCILQETVQGDSNSDWEDWL